MYIHFWVRGFEEGLYGLPEDKEMAECWRENNATGRQKCMELRPDVIAELDRRIEEFEPK